MLKNIRKIGIHVGINMIMIRSFVFQPDKSIYSYNNSPVYAKFREALRQSAL